MSGRAILAQCWRRHCIYCGPGCQISAGCPPPRSTRASGQGASRLQLSKRSAGIARVLLFIQCLQTWLSWLLFVVHLSCSVYISTIASIRCTRDVTLPLEEQVIQTQVS